MTDDELLDAVAARLAESAPPEPREGAEVAAARALAALEDDALLDAFADALRDEPPAVEPALAAARALAAHDAHGVDWARSETEEDAPTLAVADLASARRRQAARRWAPLAAAALVALAVGAGLWATSQIPVPELPVPEERSLSAGHLVTTAPGAHLVILETPSSVRAMLEEGEALFEVVRGSDFEVDAGAVRVRVTGTVFTVTRVADAVAVRVFEGSVEIIDATGVRALRAGERFGPELASALAMRAETAARRRAPAEPAPDPRVAEPEPEPEPAVELPEPEPTVEPVPPPDPRAARRLLAAGRYAEALALAERGPSDGFAWAMVRGDALLGLGRDAAALDAYRRAERAGSARERPLAGLAAARVLADRLDRVEDARETLRRSGALAPSSPVRAAAERLDARWAAD